MPVDYHRPARLNELLRVTATIAHAGRVRVDFDQRVLRGDETLVSARVKAACVHPQTFRPVALPETLRERFQK